MVEECFCAEDVPSLKFLSSLIKLDRLDSKPSDLPISPCQRHRRGLLCPSLTGVVCLVPASCFMWVLGV